MVHGLVRGQTSPMMTSFVLVPSLICEKQNDWLWSRKSSHFTLSFLFQINILVKIIYRWAAKKLVRKLRQKVCQQSIKWFERDVPGMYMDEMEFTLDKIFNSLVQQVTTAAHVSQP